MEVIKSKKLVKRFGNLGAVKGVSFEVKEREVFGLLGPNGAGKTTIINILCTLLTPTEGEATVNAFDVVKERSQVRESIGLVFQEPALDEYLTAEQNLRFHAYAYGIPKEIHPWHLLHITFIIVAKLHEKTLFLLWQPCSISVC